MVLDSVEIYPISFLFPEQVWDKNTILLYSYFRGLFLFFRSNYFYVYEKGDLFHFFLQGWQN
jgi:hypothetical protein